MEDNNKENQDPKKKSNVKAGCFGCLGLIIIFILFGSCVAMLSDDDEELNREDNISHEEEIEQDEPIADVEETEPLSVNDLIEQTVINTLGETTNMDEPRIIELTINDHAGTEDPDDKIVLASLNSNENLTTNLTRRGILLNSAEVFEELFAIEEVEQVSLRWYFPLQDTYGIVSPGEVLRVEIDREINDKINWGNFDTDNFERIAIQYQEHPGFRK